MEFALNVYLADSCVGCGNIVPVPASFWESQKRHFSDITTRATKDQLPVYV